MSKTPPKKKQPASDHVMTEFRKDSDPDGDGAYHIAIAPRKPADK